MSKLTDWLDSVGEECDRDCKHSPGPRERNISIETYHSTAAKARHLLIAHNAATREDAMREQMIADYSAVKAEGFRLFGQPSALGLEAAISVIKAAWAKAHPEKEKADG